MPAIPLGTGDWESAVNKTDRTRLRNMFIAENKASPDGLTRQSRPGTVADFTAGAGPIHALWRQDGTLDGDHLINSGGTLYRETIALGAVHAGPVQIAGGPDRAIIVGGGVAYSTDGATVTTVVMPDDVPGYEGSPAPVESVACINSFYLLTVQGSQRFYWILPGEADPDPLDFASAERTPDPIVTAKISGDEIWFLGSSGEEVWAPTNDEDAPFQRINGRVYNYGCASRDSASEMDTALFWVTADRSVVMAQGSPRIIATKSITELLKPATSFSSYTFKRDNQFFYVLSTDEVTVSYEVAGNEWARWDSFERDYFRGHVGAQNGATVRIGDNESNAIWRLDSDAYDDNGTPFIREVTGTVDNAGPPVSCNSISVRTTAGWSPDFDLEPILEVCWSDDQGATWKGWRDIPLGNMGQYGKDTVLRSCGLIRRPGRTLRFRFSDPAPFRLDYARMNDA